MGERACFIWLFSVGGCFLFAVGWLALVWLRAVFTRVRFVCFVVGFVYSFIGLFSCGCVCLACLVVVIWIIYGLVLIGGLVSFVSVLRFVVISWILGSMCVARYGSGFGLGLVVGCCFRVL